MMPEVFKRCTGNYYKVQVTKESGVHQVGDMIIINQCQSMDAYDTNGDYIMFYDFKEIERLSSLNDNQTKILIFKNKIKRFLRHGRNINV